MIIRIRQIFVSLAVCLVAIEASADNGDVSKFGVLAQTVASAGTLIAAAGALALCWKGRFKNRFQNELQGLLTFSRIC